MSLANWIPDRKIIAGGGAAVVSFLVVTAVNTWTDVTVDMETASGIVGGVFLIVGYFVPQSVTDIFNKADRLLKEFGDDEEEIVEVVNAPTEDVPQT